MMIIIFFLLISLCSIHIVNSIPIPTRCADQMGNLFSGLNFTTQKEVVIFTEGTIDHDGNIITAEVPFVTASLEFQEQARNYLTDFFGNDTLANQKFGSYVSIDIPWCTINVTVTCATRQIFGLRKTGTCTDLVDRDQPVLVSEVAGRIFIYPDQSSPCNGTATVTFTNTILEVGNVIGEYTYDIDGIFNNNSKTEPVAISTYKGAACPFERTAAR